MSFESILQGITDESERTQLAGIAQKHPNIREFTELGERVKPAADKLAALDGVNVDAELAELPNWVQYRREHYDPDRGMYKQTATALDEAERLRQRVVQLEAEKGTDMDLEQIKAALAAEGYVKKDDLKDVVTRDGLLSGLNAQSGRFQEVFATLTPLAVQHAEQFKEPIPYKDIFSYMENRRNFNPVTKQLEMPTPEEAYKAVIQPKLDALAKVEREREVAAAKEAGVAEGRRMASQSAHGSGIAMDSKGSSGGANWFMNKIFGKRAEAAKASTGRLGDGTATRAGVNDYLNKQSKVGAV